jgi:predicted transcriptional regulator
VNKLWMLRPTPSCQRLLIMREIYRDPEASQRSIARAVGISATAVNGYLCGLSVDRLVSITGETNRSTRYSLTPRGELSLADFENALEDDLRKLEAGALGRSRA